MNLTQEQRDDIVLTGNWADNEVSRCFSTPEVVVVHWPLPPGRYPGGRLLRKSRMRKKRDKFRFAEGHSMCFRGCVNAVKYDNATLQMDVSFSVHEKIT